jgi:hypothetical protein
MSLSPTNQPTNTSYLSVRVTRPHDEWENIKTVFSDTDYLCYKHGIDNGKQQHFHICVPGGSSETIRNRLRRGIGGGNKVYSVKQFTNGIRSFVFYCGHEGSEPIYSQTSSIKWEEIIKEVRTDGYYKKKTLEDHRFNPMGKPKERDWQLTYSNIVAQAVIWRNKNLPGEESLKRVVKHLIEHTKFRPSRDVYKNGVPPVYQQDFEFRIGKRTHFDMDW